MKMYVSADTIQTGNNIVALMKAQGIRVSQLQEYFGFVSPQSIYNWMSGKCAPNLDNLLALSVYFGTTLDSLVAKNIIYDNGPSSTDDGILFFKRLSTLRLRICLIFFTKPDEALQKCFVLKESSFKYNAGMFD